MKIKLFCFVSCLFVSFGLFARSAEDILLLHDQSLASFKDLKKQGKLSEKAALQIFFAELSKSFESSNLNYLHLLHKDIALLKKEIKVRSKKGERVDHLKDFLAGLIEQLKFLRKYRVQLDVSAHHLLMQKLWGDMFDLVDKGGDVLSMLPVKGIQRPGVKGLKLFIYKVQRCLDKVEEHEYRLHADWIDLKLKNYVLKIELIRLRNAAIFHPLYKGLSLKTDYPK